MTSQTPDSSKVTSSESAKPYALDSDEFYPFMFLGAPVMNEVHRDQLSRRQKHIELTDDEYADYQATMAAFDRWQERLQAADDSPR